MMYLVIASVDLDLLDGFRIGSGRVVIRGGAVGCLNVISVRVQIVDHVIFRAS